MIALIFIVCFIAWLLVGVGLVKMWKSTSEKSRDVRISIKGKDISESENQQISKSFPLNS